MNTRRIASNDDLARYLQELGAELITHGRNSEAMQVQRASRFASGSPSEFLYEAEEALKAVHRSCADVLPEIEVAQVARVLKQINEAFGQVGGA